jgi:hypothetical protein
MSNAWSELREQIEYFSQPFPEAAIAFADAHREEVTPFLVAAVARLADYPEEDANPDYVLHLYAMHLLAAWRETTAYAPLVRLGHHPDEVVEQLLGDTVTESYGRCLASVCDGDLAPLKGLVEDPAAAHWARHAALDAIMVRVFEGEASRDDLIAYLMPLGEAEAARLRLPGAETKTFELLDSVIAVATDIGASEMLEAIRGWFADGLPDSTIATMLIHPQFDPIAIAVGPLAIRWYGLMYLAGFLAFIWLGKRRAAQQPWHGMSAQDVDDLLFYGVLGVILGGRLGQVLFYEPGYYLAHPLEILAVWKGGMSFHGGFLGVLVAMALWGRKQASGLLRGHRLHRAAGAAGPDGRAHRQLHQWRTLGPGGRSGAAVGDGVSACRSAAAPPVAAVSGGR